MQQPGTRRRRFVGRLRRTFSAGAYNSAQAAAIARRADLTQPDSAPESRREGSMCARGDECVRFVRAPTEQGIASMARTICELALFSAARSVEFPDTSVAAALGVSSSLSQGSGAPSRSQRLPRP